MSFAVCSKICVGLQMAALLGEINIEHGDCGLLLQKLSTFDFEVGRETTRKRLMLRGFPCEDF
jgi:hypothetical protein